MTLALKLLVRVVKRRVERGEPLDAVLRDYPRLPEEEKERVRKSLRYKTTCKWDAGGLGISVGAR